MSEEQLTALLAKLKEDSGLREKLQGAADLVHAVALAQEAGFDVRKADWLKYLDSNMELSDAEMESVVGGVGGDQGAGQPIPCGGCWWDTAQFATYQ